MKSNSVSRILIQGNIINDISQIRQNPIDVNDYSTAIRVMTNMDG